MGSQIYAEREFRESAQGWVATEAAGEGISLQSWCLMVNYDIPWNPPRAAMGRIYPYSQEKNCLSQPTAGREVLQKLFERVARIECDRYPQRSRSSSQSTVIRLSGLKQPFRIFGRTCNQLGEVEVGEDRGEYTRDPENRFNIGHCG
ncbi:hypothetical protein [Nitrospira sp. Nam74]